METYLKTNELQFYIKALVKPYVEESRRTGELPRDFVELIKHNFFAKYAFYNAKEKTIEIGINENRNAVTPYPPLSVYSYSIEETEWLEKSFKSGAFHQDFYNKLLSR